MRHSIFANRRGFGFVLTLLVGSAPCSSAQIQPLKVLDQPATVISHLRLDGRLKVLVVSSCLSMLVEQVSVARVVSPTSNCFRIESMFVSSAG